MAPIRWRWILFGLASVLGVIAWPASERLNLDRSLQTMFAVDDPVRQDFELLESRFGISNLVVLAYRDPDFWNDDGSGLKRLQAVSQRVAAIDGVESVMELSQVDAMLSKLENPFSFFPSLTVSKGPVHPLLDSSNTLAMEFKRLFDGQTHAHGSDLVALACLLGRDSIPSKRSVQSAETLRQLRRLANSIPAGGYLVGQPVMVEEGFEAIEEDGRRLGLFSTLSLSILLIVGFRSLRWAIIAIAIVQWSLVVTRGMLVWLAWDLTMVSSMLSSIVTVIGVATSLHWMLGYQSAYERHRATGMAASQIPERALAESMRQLWWPILWACVTDAIGFGALMMTRVGPVQDYGCMMALGSLVVLVGIFALVPALALMDLPLDRWLRWLGLSKELGRVPGDRWLQGVLEHVLRGSVRGRRWVLAVTGGLLIWGIIGSLRLRVETDFIRNFQSNSPIVTSYQAVERELGGAGVWDILLAAPTPVTTDYMNVVLELEDRLRNITVGENASDRLTYVLSIADMDRAVSRASILGKLPIENRLQGISQAMGSFTKTMVHDAPDQRWFRILLRSREQSESDQKSKLIAAVRREVQATIDDPNWQRIFPTIELPGGSSPTRSQATVTGYYILLSQLVASVVLDQWFAFLIATIGIGIAIAFALRSPSLALVAILPNAVPSLIVMGWMGWMEYSVNLGAAMIAAVSMGLCVDSSLHYLHRYQRELREGRSEWQALRESQRDIGMSVALSTLGLVIGFGSLATSDFLPTVAFGTMAAFTMIGGLIGNLVLLPALIGSLSRDASREFSGRRK